MGGGDGPAEGEHRRCPDDGCGGAEGVDDAAHAEGLEELRQEHHGGHDRHVGPQASNLLPMGRGSGFAFRSFLPDSPLEPNLLEHEFGMINLLEHEFGIRNLLDHEFGIRNLLEHEF